MEGAPEHVGQLDRMKETSNFKATFIIPYTGTQTPAYLPLFFHSCAYNSSYRFLFFTDLKITETLPKNVEIVYFTKEMFEDLILRNTGIKAKLQRFYKICDFKPVFGEIFNEYLTECEFWGHTDIDLIYGDLDKFLDPILDHYDVFSFRKEYHTGSFAIYRNTPEVNSLYKKINSYYETLSHPTHFAFDEVSRFKSRKGNIYRYLLAGSNLFDEETEVESFTHLILDREKTGDIRIFSKTQIKEGILPDETLIHSNGSLFSESGQEYLLYHFVLEKAVSGFSYPQWKSIPEVFFITRYGFHKRRKFVPLEKLFRKIRLYFTVYPAKLLQKVRQMAGSRVSVNEASV